MLNKNELIDEIRAAGTDNLGHFGNGYLKEGGYSLQQNPEEFAEVIAFLSELLEPNSSYLEIGIASGGTLRFMCEKLGFEKVFAIDNRGHARAGEQEENIEQLPLHVDFEMLVGDSHKPNTKAWIERVVKYVDLAFIDGDHSYDGCKQDLEMVMPHARYVMLHDTVACEGVKRVWDEAIKEGKIRAVLHVAGKERPLGIGIAEVVIR